MTDKEIKSYKFRWVICDEAQHIKNLGAKRTAKAITIKATKRWLSSGKTILL
jgi:SNF2 family DNA or RNA helicase